MTVLEALEAAPREDAVIRATAWLFARAWPWWFVPPFVDDLLWNWLCELQARRYLAFMADHGVSGS